MFKRHVFPALIGLLAFLVTWAVIGYVNPLLDLSNAVKGFIKIAASIAAGITVNNILSRAMRD